MCTWVGAYEYKCLQWPEASDPLNLEWQMAVRQLSWMLETELQSSRRVLLITENFPSPFPGIVKKKIRGDSLKEFSSLLSLLQMVANSI